jgi:hypothetical protein
MSEPFTYALLGNLLIKLHRTRASTTECAPRRSPVRTVNLTKLPPLSGRLARFSELPHTAAYSM